MFRNEDLSAKKNFDDCYFYFYSTCKKGTSCPFRHCEAALGTEVVCSLWQAGKCFRLSCPLRHMESQRDRSTIACYWENQPGGCRKPHCVFRHCRPREGLDNINANKDLILPVAVADADENKWTSTPSNRIVVQNSGQEQKNWVITTEEEENSLPLPPAVEPLVVCFDEESDTESCTSTPVKAPDQERRVQLFSGDAVDKIQITSSVRKLNTKKGKLKKSNIELGIKTLQEIREEKTQIGIKPACSSSEDENIIELIGDQSKDVSDSNIDKKAKDLRIKIQQKRTVTTKPDSTTTDKNLDFKIKTLEEIRKEKAQSFKDLDSNTPDKEKDDVNIIQGETKENKAGSLKSRRQTIVRKERNRKASSSEDKITSSVEVTTAKTHPKKLKRQSIEIYRPPKSENVVKEESPTSSKRRKQQDKEKNDAKEFRVKSLDEIREERKLRELQKLKNNKVEIEEEPDKLDTSSLKNRHPRITFKGSNSGKQEKRKSEISPLTPFLNKKSCPLRKSAAEESRDLVNYESDYLESDFHSSNDRLLKNSLRTDSSEEVAPFRKIQETYLYQNVVLNQSQDSPSSNDSLCISSSGMSRSKDEVNSSPLAPSNDSGNGAAVESQLSPSQQSLNLSIEYSIAKEISATESRETVTSTRRKRLESSSSKSADSSKISQRKQSSRDLSDGGIDLEAELSLLLDDDEEDLSTTDLKEEDLLLELDEIINS